MRTTRTNVFINTELKGDLAEDIKLHTLCERYPYARFFAIAPTEYLYRFKWLLNLVLITPDENGAYHITKEMQPLRVGIFARRVRDDYIEFLRKLTDPAEIKSSLLEECDLVLDIKSWGLEPLLLSSMPLIPEKIHKAVIVPGNSSCAVPPNCFADRIRSLIKQDHQITMLAFSHSDDSEALMQQVMDELSEDERSHVFCMVYDKDIDVLLREFAEAELAVTASAEAYIIAKLCSCNTEHLGTPLENDTADPELFFSELDDILLI